MTYKEAKSYADYALDDFYAAFQKLGGNPKIKKHVYRQIVINFVVYTFDAYISGEGDRKVAIKNYSQWLNENHPTVTVGQVFHSVDSVHCYT